MAKNRITAVWIIVASLLMTSANGEPRAQTATNDDSVVTTLGTEVETLASRTKPRDWKMIHSCLYYALAGQYLLAKHGISAKVSVGAVDYAPGTPIHHGISPHAWLETNDFFIDYSTLPRWGKTSVIPRALVASHPAAVRPGLTRVLAIHRPDDHDLTNYLADHRARFDGIVNGDD